MEISIKYFSFNVQFQQIIDEMINKTNFFYR